MIQTILGKKLGQTQGFLENGTRIPLTRILVKGNVISQIKTVDRDGYEALQLGFLETKKANKPLSGHAKKSGLKTTPRFYRETKADKIDDHELGSEVNPQEVVEAGDIVNVTGISKGKGYAGVVKRHHFKGGPKTHGQSDRHRAPGSIGQSTTPGRVYKGKRMAGRMGNAKVTVKNLEVIELNDNEMLIKGLIPGPIGTIVTITKTSVNKKHIGLYKEPVKEEEVVEAKVEEIGETVEEQEKMREETEKKADEAEIAEKEALQVANKEGNTEEETKSEAQKADTAVDEKEEGVSEEVATGENEAPSEESLDTKEEKAEEKKEDKADAK